MLGPRLLGEQRSLCGSRTTAGWSHLVTWALSCLPSPLGHVSCDVIETSGPADDAPTSQQMSALHQQPVGSPPPAQTCVGSTSAVLPRTSTGSGSASAPLVAGTGLSWTLTRTTRGAAGGRRALGLWCPLPAASWGGGVYSASCFGRAFLGLCLCPPPCHPVGALPRALAWLCSSCPPRDRPACTACERRLVLRGSKLQTRDFVPRNRV